MTIKRATAEKEHRCVWCSNRVLVGSSYFRERTVQDGDFYSNAWHEACRLAYRKTMRNLSSGDFIELVGDFEMPWHALYGIELEARAA